jgi:hypothetical protein
MDLSKFGINKDNVKEIIDEYLKETLGKEEWDTQSDPLK